MRLLTRELETFQKSLHAKAKTEPRYRFYSLWDKIYRIDVLSLAYRRCRQNRGKCGVDRVTFDAIESSGLEKWLGKLQQELKFKHYKPQPLLRVWIPKASGGKRPLSIATIKDRVVQAAAVILLEPIFEVDLTPNQYGFRPNLDAKLAIRRTFYHITQHGRREIVDADLSDYFSTIPHSALLRSLARRIADGQMLSVVKSWLQVTVVEITKTGMKQSSQAKDEHRGVPQGSPLSPLLANVYFRRFVLAWEKLGYSETLNAKVVNYADDLVICTVPGNGAEAMAKMRMIMNRLGLQLNEAKTRLVTLPHKGFDFLGYTFDKSYAKDGKAYIGTKPSKKSVSRVKRKIHVETSRRWLTSTVEKRIEEINRILIGWSNYFNQGPVLKAYDDLRRYTEKRFRRWLIKKHKQRGTGYRQYSDDYLYEILKLHKLPRRRIDLSRAKA